VAEDRDLRVAYNVGYFLASVVTISYVKILFHAVIFRKFDKTVHPSDRLELLGSM
jgi:hypothetical protein